MSRPSVVLGQWVSPTKRQGTKGPGNLDAEGPFVQKKYIRLKTSKETTQLKEQKKVSYGRSRKIEQNWKQY